MNFLRFHSFLYGEVRWVWWRREWRWSGLHHHRLCSMGGGVGGGEEERLEEERDKYYMRFQWQMASYICFREVNIQRMANISRSDEDRYHLSWVMRISQKLAKAYGA